MNIKRSPGFVDIKDDSPGLKKTHIIHFSTSNPDAFERFLRAAMETAAGVKAASSMHHDINSTGFCVDAVSTDPPYGLGFRGMGWSSMTDPPCGLGFRGMGMALHGCVVFVLGSILLGFLFRGDIQ